jgi:UDP-N-acetylmuramyl pentapeptide phosphotransferase/UDP-N-acetylglucosamine-1-phosphate transferase
MNYLAAIGVLVGTAMASFLLGFGVYCFLERRRIVDEPGPRSSHERPTLRGGGIGIVLALLGGGGALLAFHGGGTLLALLSTCLALAAVSFIDDTRPLPASIRFGCHALAALAVLLSLSWTMPVLELSSGWQLTVPPAVGLLVSFLWLAGYTNAFNFMDGINGIAAGQAVITAAGCGLLTGLATGKWTATPVLFAFVIAGAAAGFLPHNFPHARMFMGDVGSVPLGFLLASLVLWLTRDGGPALLIPLALLHGNFVFDTAFTLVRRTLRGEKWHHAHKEHFYQRLNQSGKSHAFVTGWELALQAVVLTLLALYVRCEWVSARVLLITAIVLLWAAFFWVCERAFRRSESGWTRPVRAD